MPKIKTSIIIAFLVGIFFTGLVLLAAKKAKPLMQKIKHKIEQRMIANIPLAKEPLVICDFETPEDLNKWSFSNAKMELTNEYASSGKYAAKIYVRPSSDASGARIDKYFKQNKKITDWSRYEVVSFDLFNPGNTEERVILQIKDMDESRVKINLHLKPNTHNPINIDIAGLWNEIKADKISQFNLCLWDNKAEKVFYLDNLRLLPAAAFAKQNKNITDAEFIPQKGEKIYATGDYFYFNRQKWLKIDTQRNISFIQIPLVIANQASFNNVFLSGGIPFARGEIFSTDNLKLVGNSTGDLPFQFKILSYWPDKSIKWGLLEFKPAIPGQTEQKYYLCYGTGLNKEKFSSLLNIKDEPDSITVNTGSLEFSVSKRKFYLFDSVRLGQNLVSTKADLILNFQGHEYHSSLDKDVSVILEESGPLKAVIKASGWFVSEKGSKFCKFVTRISAFAGESYLKVQHTFIYTGYPENKYHYLYEGKRLPENEPIDAIYITLPFTVKEGSKYTFGVDNQIMQGDFTDTVSIFQDKFNDYTVIKRGKTLGTGKKLEGWLDFGSNDFSVTVGIKNFWQQFPKSYLIDKDKQCLEVYLWPKEAGKLDLKTTEAAYGPDSVARGSAFGLAKTHEIDFYFHEKDHSQSNVKEIITGLSSDALIMSESAWIADTKALGKVLPVDRRLYSEEDFLSRLFDWGNRQIENFGWYGMTDFGDTLSWYRKESFDKSYDDWGWHPEGRWGWYNCEAVSTHTGALLQFLRTGEHKYFAFGANLARHIMDIDTCHYNTVANDSRLKNTISDDYSQVGSMHRHNGNHWGGENAETTHTNITGLVFYYYITGDPRTKDVIEEVGSFFLKERIYYFRHPDIVAQRAIANVLWGEVLLYELTQDERYKKAADKWVNLLYLGQRHNGSWLENYNPVKNRWEGSPATGFMRAYTVPALIEYHKLTGNKAIGECIVKVADMLMNEEYSSDFDATAYSYWLTGEKKYLEGIKNRLDVALKHQRQSDDPIWNGMVYQKPYYTRVSEFLYQMPYAFEVLADEK
jgi:hypothetical protein